MFSTVPNLICPEPVLLASNSLGDINALEGCVRLAARLSVGCCYMYVEGSGVVVLNWLEWIVGLELTI